MQMHRRYSVAIMEFMRATSKTGPQDFQDNDYKYTVYCLTGAYDEIQCKEISVSFFFVNGCPSPAGRICVLGMTHKSYSRLSAVWKSQAIPLILGGNAMLRNAALAVRT